MRTEQFVLTDLVEDERGLVAYQSFSLKDSEETTVYYTEEVVAQILKYGRKLSETQAKGPVSECVITIPSYFN